MGAHQKIDRVARYHLGLLIKDNRVFPGVRSILYFEGKNGPDGIKRKSPAQDEPWHYFNPLDPGDTRLLDIIDDHYARLVLALRAHSRERAAFEAAWLAHALVDGLTPAHHFPYEEALIELRGGASIDTRTTIKQKLIMPGDTTLEMLQNNWKMWGSKGLMTTHGLFELGVASLIAPLTFNDSVPTADMVDAVRGRDIREYYREQAQAVLALGLYDNFYKSGWTALLAQQVRTELCPRIISVVTLFWYKALVDAELVGRSS